MARFKVLRQHVHSPRKRARRGLVLELDPESVYTQRGLANRHLIPTTEPVDGDLEDMGPRRWKSPEQTKRAEAKRREREAAEDTQGPSPADPAVKAAERLVHGTVAQVSERVRDADTRVLQLAIHAEGYGANRKGALEAILTELERREDNPETGGPEGSDDDAETLELMSQAEELVEAPDLDTAVREADTRVLQLALTAEQQGQDREEVLETILGELEAREDAEGEED